MRVKERELWPRLKEFMKHLAPGLVEDRALQRELVKLGIDRHTVRYHRGLERGDVARGPRHRRGRPRRPSDGTIDTVLTLLTTQRRRISRTASEWLGQIPPDEFEQVTQRWRRFLRFDTHIAPGVPWEGRPAWIFEPNLDTAPAVLEDGSWDPQGKSAEVLLKLAQYHTRQLALQRAGNEVCIATPVLSLSLWPDEVLDHVMIINRQSKCGDLRDVYFQRTAQLREHMHAGRSVAVLFQIDDTKDFVKGKLEARELRMLFGQLQRLPPTTRFKVVEGVRSIGGLSMMLTRGEHAGFAVADQLVKQTLTRTPTIGFRHSRPRDYDLLLEQFSDLWSFGAREVSVDELHEMMFGSASAAQSFRR
jgi:hypothetical protein